MEKTIYKYKLNMGLLGSVEMPKGAEILAIQAQNEIPCIWALVDPYEENEVRIFEIFGTGHPIPECDPGFSRKFLSTFQMQGGALVFHVFEMLTT